jgi:prepilin-type N-terminal cleavage/methylation domain-containing protein
MIATYSRHRRALTLVELLVVMVIMLVLATIVVAFAPGFQDAQKVSRGADQLQGWLLTARQWARKDRVPTGIRFSVVNNAVTDLQYIQQPPTFIVPYAVPALTPGLQPVSRRISLNTAGSVTTASLDIMGSTPLQPGQSISDFSGGLGMSSLATSSKLWPIQVGDYLVIHQTVCSVASFGSSPTAAGLSDLITLASPAPGNLGTLPPTSDYYFVRAPRPIVGESTLTLPQDVTIDFSAGKSVFTPTNGQFDILFGPSGEVLSPSSSTIGKIVFWILDPTKPAGNTQDTLIAVDIRTGLIASQPVGPAGSPYAYTTDGRSSGL